MYTLFLLPVIQILLWILWALFQEVGRQESDRLPKKKVFNPLEVIEKKGNKVLPSVTSLRDNSQLGGFTYEAKIKKVV